MCLWTIGFLLLFLHLTSLFRYSPLPQSPIAPPPPPIPSGLNFFQLFGQCPIFSGVDGVWFLCFYATFGRWFFSLSVLFSFLLSFLSFFFYLFISSEFTPARLFLAFFSFHIFDVSAGLTFFLLLFFCYFCSPVFAQTCNYLGFLLCNLKLLLFLMGGGGGGGRLLC